MPASDSDEPLDDGADAIAIVGMAVHLPGARNASEYWRNLRDGVESVRFYTADELRAEGVSGDLLRNPQYVKSAAPLDEMEHFDAEFFGFSPKEAAIMDPQHRHFLECCWEALEDAGHPPETFGGSVGVFAGCGMGSYFIFNLLTNPELVRSVGLFLLRHTGNDKDFLATRASYCLDLKGPSINVQTACSTSLVAAHMASQSLLSGECDMALAGGVTIEVPHRRGYVYQEGEILSPDGHCHAFDHRSQGTIFGSGAGVVVLRRLSDALADGDHVYAVLKGSAVNNDGSGKVGYLAPSVDGQAAAIAEALAVADVTADTIDYVECHGTGTPMGDPIEISALTQAFRETSDGTGYCGIGSVKTNIGHLDTAAGVASLVKVSLALHHRQLPPSLNYEKPNPTIEFERTPFFVNDELRAWQATDTPRRAGVNSLGVGGTNAHAILEEAPAALPSRPGTRAQQLLVLSARNRRALDGAAKKLAAWLREHEDANLADVAFTLLRGRRAFTQRRVLAVTSVADAIEQLEANDPRRCFTHTAADDAPTVTFLLPGGGAQYRGMGAGLYAAEPLFKRHVDRGLELLKTKVDFDLRALWFADSDPDGAVAAELERPAVQLPAIFLTEYALAQLWMSWGVQPTALLGHSLGENTAACLAGVMSFEDCLGLVTLRGKLFETVPAGGMLSVSAPREKIEPLLTEHLDLGVVNAPELCVVSGPEQDLDAFGELLAAKDIEAQKIRISIAAHSRMLEPILEPFGAYLKSIKLSAPKLPFLSNRSGTWITAAEATDPMYWVGHLRHTVRFSDCAATLLEQPGRVFLEVGPGRTLSSLVKQQPGLRPEQAAIPALRHPDEDVADETYLLAAYGRLWAAGGELDDQRLWPGETRRRVSLPTYAFQRQRYWIEPGASLAVETEGDDRLERIESLEDWGYRPVWRPVPLGPPPAAQAQPETWLVFMDGAGIGRALAARLKDAGHEVIEVRESDAYYRVSERQYSLSPEHGRDGYDALVRDLVASGKVPSRVLHLWTTTADESFRPGSSFFHRNLERGFYSLFFLAQALGGEGVRGPVHVLAVSNGMQRAGREPLLYPEKALLLGPCKVIPREFPGYTCASVDIALPDFSHKRFGAKKALTAAVEELANLLHAELFQPPANAVVAYREGARLVEVYERAPLAAPAKTAAARIRPRGTYLVTGGLGGIGLALAEHLARTAQARLILVGRSPLPPRAEWDEFARVNGPGHGASAKIAKVRELEAAGAEVLAASADVTDLEAMRAVLAAAEAKFGPVHGVFHTAGVLRDGLILSKSQADAEDVFAPKVHGTQVLAALFEGKPLELFVLFSSTSTAIAPAGQIDYVAANAYQNAFAASQVDMPGRLTLAVNWGVWNQVGMAAEAASKMGRPAAAPVKEERVPARHPLFDARVKQGTGAGALTAVYTTATHWILDEHRTKAGHALLPGTGYLELARAALREHGEERAFEIRDLYFFRPLYVGDDEAKEIRVRLERDEEGYGFFVQSKSVLGDGRVGWENHAQARLLLHALEQPAALDVAAVDARCTEARATDADGKLRTGQMQHLAFGPRWSVLRQVGYAPRLTGEPGEALARLSLPEAFASDLDEFGLHPALLDLATGFAMRLIEGYDEAASRELWVPISYRSVKVHGRLPREVWSWVRTHGANRAGAEFASFDVTLTDADGRVLLDVSEFSIKRLAAGTDFAAAPKPTAAELELEQEDGALAGVRPLSPAELTFQHNLEQGIRPEEGMQALERLLANGREPLAIVTSLDLHELIEQAGRATVTEAEDGTKFARPELDSEYVEPRSDVEKTLVGYWEELLGVDQVGVQDSFFDLGGHSLIAVRLFAKIKKAYHVDYPISVLFEAPTIEKGAALIQAAIGGDGSESGASSEVTHRTRYTHLVPMSAGSAGSAGSAWSAGSAGSAGSGTSDATPFFLVAGMFGNVLNLRHLAHLVGADRPFYGLQARGLYGDHQPHETFEEMARDYLAEVRTVQPRGPYLLGGFSGGGITAYEMTRQLREQGEEVALLVLLDTPLPTFPPLSAVDKATIHVQRLMQRGPSYITGWAKDRIKWELDRFRDRFQEQPEDEPNGSPSNFHSEEIEAAFRRSLEKYEVRYYPGTVHLFRPKLDIAHRLSGGRVTNELREFLMEDNGWTPYVDGIEIHEVPGDHDGMVLEPNVRVLAARIRACIEAVEAERRATRTATG